MPMEYELRIGVCGCTTNFHNSLPGQKIFVYHFRDGNSDSPETLRIKVVHIPEQSQRETLLANHCHAFLDNHGDNVSLRFIKISPTGQLLIGDIYGSVEWNDEIPSNLQIAQAVQHKIRKMMDKAAFCAWI